MDDSTSLAPNKKTKNRNRLQFVLHFSAKFKVKTIVRAPARESVVEVLSNVEQRFKFKDVSVTKHVEKLGENNTKDIINQKGFYHRQ